MCKIKNTKSLKWLFHFCLPVLLNMGLLLFACKHVDAQEQIGIAQSNNHVTEGIRLNPSFGVDAKPWLDLHLAGAYGYFSNNYAYLGRREVSLYHLSFDNDFLVNSVEERKYLDSEARVAGPGFSLVMGKFYIGFGSAVRYMATGRDVPLSMAQNYWFEWREDDHIGKQFQTGDFRIKQAGWAEFNFSGGGILYAKGRNMITGGITAKYLRGGNQSGFLVDNFDFEVPDENTFIVNDFNGTYTTTPFTTGGGNGVAMDLGFTFKRMIDRVDGYTPHVVEANCKKIDYVYRVGISMVDLGYLRYSANGGTVFRNISGGSAQWDRLQNRIMLDNYDWVTRDLDARFLNNANETDNTVSARMPLGISFQYDYNLGANKQRKNQKNNWYINVSGMYGVPQPGSYGAERMSWLAVTPRYETKRFDLSVPVSVTGRGIPHVGLGLRWWSVSLGFTNFLPLLAYRDNYHFGGYVHFKHAIFTSNSCRRGFVPDEPDWDSRKCTNPKVRFPSFRRKKRKQMRKKQKRYLK